MLVSYNWLKEYLGDDIPSAEEVEKLLTFHSFEIEGIESKDGDVVIDIDILPNRSSDCLSHRGIAREVATLIDKPLRHDPFSVEPELSKTDKVSITIEDAEVCSRFTATLFTDIEVKDSPDWLKNRLKVLGQRPINNIVDATNYVMLSLGQPMHVYDADLFPQVDGQWQFEVRTSREGEEVSLLPEGGGSSARVVELRGDETLVLEKSTNTAVGLAGVKGGTFAEVHSGSKNVIIEAATWNPIITRSTARRLGIVIDASKRYENDLSSEMPVYAQTEIINLIKDIAGGTFEGFVDVYPSPKAHNTVEVSPLQVNALLGLSLVTEEMISILKRAGISVTLEGDFLQCKSPWERTDLNIAEDFIEEIGRVYGYDKVVSIVPDKVDLVEYNSKHYYSEKIRQILFSFGFSELITSSFRKKDTIQLANSLASDKSYMRSSLSKNISDALDKNANFPALLGIEDVRVFEIGTVFDKTKDSVSEHTSLCIGLRIKPSGYSGKEDSLLEEFIEAIGKTLGVRIEWKIEKGVAETNISDLLDKLPAPETYEAVDLAEDTQYKPFSMYPFTTRDIAMWVPEGIKPDEVASILREQAGELCLRVDQFDEFTKDGRTSYGFRLVFQSQEKTLTDDEVNNVMDEVYRAVAEKGWEVR